MDSLDLVACPGGVNLVTAVSLAPAVGTEIHFESTRQFLDEGAAAVFLIVWFQPFFQQFFEQVDSFAAVSVLQHIAKQLSRPAHVDQRLDFSQGICRPATTITHWENSVPTDLKTKEWHGVSTTMQIGNNFSLEK